MSTQYQFKWHPFPKEIPPEDGNYLVTYDAVDHVEVFTAQFIDWRSDDVTNPYSWETEYEEVPCERVTAWAELPAPYRKRRKTNARN